MVRDGTLSQEEIDALLMGQEDPYIKLRKIEKPMTDILSQDEIDQLLSAISDDKTGGKWEDWTGLERKKVKIYDFKRPDTFSKEQIQVISSISETYSRLTEVVLLSKLKTKISLHLSSVSQLCFDEFLRSIPNPCLISVVDATPLKGSVFMEMDPTISSLFIDLVCGGRGKKYKMERAHTDSELSILEGLIVPMLGNLRESWSKILDLRPRLASVETDPSLCRIYPSNEMGILVTIEVSLCKEDSFMNIFFPESTLREIKNKLTYETYYNPEESYKRSSPIVETISHDCLIKYKDEPLIINSELASLKKGDLIFLKSRDMEIVI
jgi:flagellar motor switch protein FliM